MARQHLRRQKFAGPRKLSFIPQYLYFCVTFIKKTKLNFLKEAFWKFIKSLQQIESFHYYFTLNSTLVHRLLTGLTAQQIGTAARWYSNKTPLFISGCYPVPKRKCYKVPDYKVRSIPRQCASRDLLGWTC